MLKKLLLNLQLFADGGGDGGDGGSASASVGETVGNNESGEMEIPAFVPEKAKKIYQKAMQKHSGSTTDASTQNSDNGQPTNDQSTTEKLSYADLIKSDDYREEHEAYMRNTIGDRLKKYKGIEEELKKTKALLGNVADKYGVNPNDENYYEVLNERIEADDSYYEKYAMEHDCSTEEARRMVTMERKAAQFDAQQEAREKQEHDRQRMMVLMQNAEKTKEQFPDFDLDTEMQNDDFRRICAATNGNTTAAYKACHHDEIITNTVRRASRQIQNQTAQAVASNIARPTENGLSSTAPSVVQQDFKNMSLDQLNEYRRKHFG